MSMDVSEYSRMLAAQAETVCFNLLPNGVVRGREFFIGSVNGEAGNSLKVCVAGAKAGIWSDFGGNDKGDLITLWSAVRGLSMKDTLRDVKAYLGVSDPVFASPKKVYRRPTRPTAARKTAPESAVTRYLLGRGLTADVIRLYQVAESTEVGPFDGWQKQEPWRADWIVFPYKRDGELLLIKYLNLERRDGKKLTLVEPGCEPCLFGWQAIAEETRSIAICEGEIDAMTLFGYGFPALSVPFGGGSGDKQASWIESEWDSLERFSDIFLCMDADAAGQEAIVEIVKRLGAHRCRIVTLPFKDANECLKNGVTKDEIEACFANAKTLDPQELVGAESFLDDVMREFYPPSGEKPGFTLPWQKRGQEFRFSPGEVTVWTGCNGHGKSLALSQVMLHAMGCGERVCIGSFEMPARKTLARMARQALAVELPTAEEVVRFHGWLAGQLWLYNHVGSIQVDRLMQVFEYANRRYGVKQFVIDSLLKCGISSDDYNSQTSFVEKICAFAMSTGSHIHLVAHSRKLESELFEVGKMDIKGTGNIGDLAFNILSVWRNKKKEKQLEAIESGQQVKGLSEYEVRGFPDAMIHCSKCREDGTLEGSWPLWFHPGALQYLNHPNDACLEYCFEVNNPAPRCEPDF